MGDAEKHGLAEALTGLLSDAERNLQRSLDVNPQALGGILSLESDLGIVESALRDRPESIQFAESRRQLATAAFAASLGLYGLAYAGVRVFLELSFAAVHFSAHELERRRWASDRADFSWRAALDPETGVLSPSFLREFAPDAVGEAHVEREKASRAYRECSQHLHGKNSATEELPKQIEFDPNALAVWVALATEAAEAVLFLVYARYSADLLRSSPGFMQVVENRFAHLASAQLQLGMK